MATFVRDHRVALLDLPGHVDPRDPGDSRVPVDPDDVRVLVVDGRLPRFPGRWPAPADLAATAGDPGAVVAGPPTREPDGVITNVLARSGAPVEGDWLPLSDLADLADVADGVSPAARDAVAAAARVWTGGPVDDGRAPWFLPGWHARTTAWLDDVLAERGLVRTAACQPVKLWSLSAVLRVPVTGSGARAADEAGPARDLWFKATCDGFRAEAALTAAVAALDPAAAPRVVAVEPDRAWLLMEDLPGADLDTDPGLAPLVATRLAELQQASLDAGRRAALAAAGAPDRGHRATVAGVRDVLRHSVERPLMSAEVLDRLPDLETWLVGRLDELWSHPVPDTLAHGDLHLGNVVWLADQQRPVLFDWTDACWTHPFLDARHLAASAAGDTEDAGGDPAAAESVAAAVRDAFLDAWRRRLPGVDLDEVWRAAEVAETAFQMVTFEQIYRAQPEVSRWELSTMVVDAVERLLAAMDAAPPAQPSR